MNKRGIELSFKFIFSLILVAVIIVVGFFVIKTFLDRAEQMNFNLAYQDVQDSVNSVWNGASEASKVVEITAPRGVLKFCFIEGATCTGLDECEEISYLIGNGDNFFFYPIDLAERYGTKSNWKIEHLTIEGDDCIEKQGNKFRLRITKEIDGGPKITIENA
ncbi:MAG: hypothetical protein ABH817_00040 [archaeon]